MESFKTEQQNHIPTTSFNLLEQLPDDFFYAVMEKLPARVIENTVRQLSKNCYRRIELRRARLPRVCINLLRVKGNKFCYRMLSGGAMYYEGDYDYTKRIDPANLSQHLEYLTKRATFYTLYFEDVYWDIFANYKFECEELACCVFVTTLSPERFMDIFRSMRPTCSLLISATGHNKIFPVPRDFFTNNYAIGLQDVRLFGHGNAMVDPLNDTFLLNSTPWILLSHFQASFGCTLNGILTMIRDWYTSERQIGSIGLRVVGGEAQRLNFYHNLPGLQAVPALVPGYTYSRCALKRANGDVVELGVDIKKQGYLQIYMVQLVPGPEAD